jgi:hypothetical protein
MHDYAAINVAAGFSGKGKSFGLDVLQGAKRRRL